MKTEKTAKEKAIELLEKFKSLVNGYLGSSYLTGTEFPEQILAEAKKCVLIHIEESQDLLWETDNSMTLTNSHKYNFLSEIKKELYEITE